MPQEFAALVETVEAKVVSTFVGFQERADTAVYRVRYGGGKSNPPKD